MNHPLAFCCGLTLTATALWGGEDFSDRLEQTLTWSAQHDTLRARLSGTFEFEGYALPVSAPGLIHTEDRTLFSPRLSLWLDAQLGDRFYFFAQSRVDHGFDPSDGGSEVRLDEYALRFTPHPRGQLNFQVGKFATVVGNWVTRHRSWDNPFITAPLPYENQMPLWDFAAVSSLNQLLQWAYIRPNSPARNEYKDKAHRLPIVWGPSYASGAAFTGTTGRADYAFEVKNAALSSRPNRWDAAQTQWQQPTVSGRVGYRPDQRWNLGFSASTGTYLSANARSSLPVGSTLSDHRETVFGQDLSFAWHHLQLWAECYEASYHIPRLGRATTTAGYLEVKYKFTPQFFGALRWNRQVYGTIPDGVGGDVRWGRNVSRIDLAAGYRFTPHSELKGQYSDQYGGLGSRDQHARTLAGQFILRF